VLRGIDTAIEVLGWSLAVFFVVMLFAGPQVIAEDKPESKAADAAGAAPAGGDSEEESGGGGEDAAAPGGKVVFTDNCGSCHTLSAAGTSGSVGPNLDDTSLDAAAIEGVVSDGSGTMPAFGDKLSADEITAVAEFVAGN